MNVYDFKVKSIDGEEISLSQYRDKVLIITNTASKCGFTPQYEDLQKIYDKFNAKGFEVLAFPSNQFAEQEPGTNEEVKNFCQINYGVSFPLFAKIDVRGPNAHPLFKYLTEQMPFKGFNLNHPIGGKLFGVLKERFPEYLEGDSIKWNFTKFVIDRNGNVVSRHEPTTSPLELEAEIERLLL